jgi:hypothetical protein
MVAIADVPSDSALHGLELRADYWDAYQIEVAGPPPTALDAYLAFARRTPRWIDRLMTLRNRTVQLLGLKDVGQLAAAPLRTDRRLAPGDRVGIFTIRSVRAEEAVLEILDSHLDVVVSVYRDGSDPARLTLTTMVFEHNWIGRLYMVPVAPMHRIVVRAILSRQPDFSCRP